MTQLQTCSRGVFRMIVAVVLASVIPIGEAAAQESPPEAAGIRIIRDVSYGPHPRQVMDFYLPQAGPTPRPLVICIHGGGWAAGDKRSFAWLGQALAARGFAAVSLSYRFAPEFRAPAQMDDVQRAVRWLRKNAAKYELDADRFGAIGGSAGGHLASWLGVVDVRDDPDRREAGDLGGPELAEYSSRVQCVVDCYGPVDLLAMMSSASAPIVQQFVGKPLEGNEEAYRQASPFWQVKKNPPPFLIVHGTKDIGTSRGQVPIEQSIEFQKKLEAAGGEAVLLKLEGAGHGFTGNGSSRYAQQTQAAAIEFFQKHLGSRRAPERPGDSPSVKREGN